MASRDEEFTVRKPEESSPSLNTLQKTGGGKNYESAVTVVPTAKEIHDAEPKNPSNTQECEDDPKRNQTPQKSFFYEPLDKMEVVEALAAKGILLSGSNTSAVVRKGAPPSQIISDLGGLNRSKTSAAGTEKSWDNSGLRGYEGSPRSNRQSGSEAEGGSSANSDDDEFSSEDEDAFSEDDGEDDFARDLSNSKRSDNSSSSPGSQQTYRKRKKRESDPFATKWLGMRYKCPDVETFFLRFMLQYRGAHFYCAMVATILILALDTSGNFIKSVLSVTLFLIGLAIHILQWLYLAYLKFNKHTPDARAHMVEIFVTLTFAGFSVASGVAEGYGFVSCLRKDGPGMYCTTELPNTVFGLPAILLAFGARLHMKLFMVVSAYVCMIVTLALNWTMGEKEKQVGRDQGYEYHTEHYNFARYKVAFLAYPLLIFAIQIVVFIIRERLQRNVFEASVRLAQYYKDIEVYVELVNGVMTTLLPPQVLDRLLSGSAIIDAQDATVLQSDLVGFTPWCGPRHPTEVVEMLSAVVESFDQLAASYGIIRMKTMGDGYVAACGIPEKLGPKAPNHATLMVMFGYHMHTILRRLCGLAAYDTIAPKEQKSDDPMPMFEVVDSSAEQFDKFESILKANRSGNWGALTIRVGIHTGFVVGAIVSIRRWTYELFGPVPKLAHDLETHCAQPSSVALSSATFSAASGCEWVKQRAECVHYGGSPAPVVIATTNQAAFLLKYDPAHPVIPSTLDGSQQEAPGPGASDSSPSGGAPAPVAPLALEAKDESGTSLRTTASSANQATFNGPLFRKRLASMANSLHSGTASTGDATDESVVVSTSRAFPRGGLLLVDDPEHSHRSADSGTTATTGGGTSYSSATPVEDPLDEGGEHFHYLEALPALALQVVQTRPEEDDDGENTQHNPDASKLEASNEAGLSTFGETANGTSRSSILSLAGYQAFMILQTEMDRDNLGWAALVFGIEFLGMILTALYLSTSWSRSRYYALAWCLVSSTSIVILSSVESGRYYPKSLLISLTLHAMILCLLPISKPLAMVANVLGICLPNILIIYFYLQLNVFEVFVGILVMAGVIFATWNVHRDYDEWEKTSAVMETAISNSFRELNFLVGVLRLKFPDHVIGPLIARHRTNIGEIGYELDPASVIFLQFGWWTDARQQKQQQHFQNTHNHGGKASHRRRAHHNKSMQARLLVDSLAKTHMVLDQLLEEWGSGAFQQEAGHNKSSNRKQGSIDKVKTLGDVVLLVGGLQNDDESNSSESWSTRRRRGAQAKLAARKAACVDAVEFLSIVQARLAKGIQLLAALHIGNVTAAIIGKQQLEYDIFGTTVNKAAGVLSSCYNIAAPRAPTAHEKVPGANPGDSVAPHDAVDQPGSPANSSPPAAMSSLLPTSPSEQVITIATHPDVARSPTSPGPSTGPKDDPVWSLTQSGAGPLASGGASPEAESLLPPVEVGTSSNNPGGNILRCTDDFMLALYGYGNTRTATKHRSGLGSGPLGGGDDALSLDMEPWDEVKERRALLLEEEEKQRQRQEQQQQMRGSPYGSPANPLALPVLGGTEEEEDEFESFQRDQELGAQERDVGDEPQLNAGSAPTPLVVQGGNDSSSTTGSPRRKEDDLVPKVFMASNRCKVRVDLKTEFDTKGLDEFVVYGISLRWQPKDRKNRTHRSGRRQKKNMEE